MAKTNGKKGAKTKPAPKTKKGEVKTKDAPKTNGPRMPTKEQWQSLQDAFGYFNRELFGGTLPQPIIGHSRHRGAHGFYKKVSYWDRKVDELRMADPEKFEEWVESGSDTLDGQVVRVGEISLNPDSLGRSVEEVFSTLVHEMAHHWQHVEGHPSRPGYHNSEWARKMESIGLMPVAMGKGGVPNGKKTGQSVGHDIIPDGPYAKAFKMMPKEFSLPWMSFDFEALKKKKSKPQPKKVKLTCGCGRSIWVKDDDEDANSIQCTTCDQFFDEEGGEGE